MDVRVALPNSTKGHFTILLVFFQTAREPQCSVRTDLVLQSFEATPAKLVV
jgi:hypothetical protein